MPDRSDQGPGSGPQSDGKPATDPIVRPYGQRVLSHLFSRDVFIAWGPTLLVIAAAVLVTIYFILPGTPQSLTISTGPKGSILQTVAEKYVPILARDGVKLRILTSAGSAQNLARVADPHSGVDAALVQDGVTTTADTSDLVSLGSLFYEPLAIYYYGQQPLTRLFALRGGRIGIGPPGSGTRFLALALLGANDIHADNTQLEPLEGNAAMNALIAHRVDAIFLSGDSATVTNFRTLMHAPNVHLFSFEHPEPYLLRFRYLAKLTIPAGAFDVGAELPRHEVTMLAPTVQLLVRSGVSSELVDLLIQAAEKVNGQGSLLEKPGEFPAPLRHSWPLSDEAVRYYKSGKTLLYRLLPFWLASLVARLWVVIVPLAVVGIPALQFAPTVYGWRMKNRIYRRYGELMDLERAALEPLSAGQRAALISRLDTIEKAVIGLKMPGAFANQLYVLRQHILFVRAHLQGT